MEIRRFQALVNFSDKTRPISVGFRPTLLFGERKALSNLEAITPDPLPPHQTGQCTFAIVWEWPEPCPMAEGAKFCVLEGERVVGNGQVITAL